MTWENFYLVCFLVGFLLSLLSFLGGSRLHLPKGMHAHVMDTRDWKMEVMRTLATIS